MARVFSSYARDNAAAAKRLEAAIDPDLDVLREITRFKTMVSDAHERLQLTDADS